MLNIAQHAQDQTRNQSADHQDSSPSLLLKLQTSSMYLNGRWTGFITKSATKRLATSMTDPGQADRARQLLEMTACWSDCQKPGLMSTASQLQEEWTPATPVSARTVCRILAHNGLQDSIAAQKPAQNKRRLRNHVAYGKAHSLTEGWTAEKWRKIDFSDESSIERCQYCRRPSGARLDPQFTQKTVKFGGGKIMVWGSSNTEVPGRSVRWMVTLIVPNINRFLPPSTFRTTRVVRFFNRIELLAIHQVPQWSFSGGRRSRSFRDGLQIWILLSISGEKWRRKLGGVSRRTARWPSMPSPTTSSTSSTTFCQTGWQLFCRPKEPIQDINYLTNEKSV